MISSNTAAFSCRHAQLLPTLVATIDAVYTLAVHVLAAACVVHLAAAVTANQQRHQHVTWIRDRVMDDWLPRSLARLIPT